MDKLYFTYNEIHETVKRLASLIKNDGFSPDVIVAIGSGGFIPARILRTFLKKPILAVGIVFYDDEEGPRDEPFKSQWIDDVDSKIRGKKVLLVDEVDDSRTTLEFCANELLKHLPEELGIAVIHDKLKEKKGKIPGNVKRVYSGSKIEDKWVCYPWDAEDIKAHDDISGKAENKKE